MFRFEHREYLYLLLILPALLALFLYYMRRKKKALRRLGAMEMLRPLMPEVALKKYYFKFWLLFTAFALFVLVIAGPQFGTKTESVKRQGIEVMVCLDVSNSMLSNDIQPTRLDKSKQILSRLVDELKDDKIGLIVFAGDAFVQLPITADYVSAKMFLQSINPTMVPTQGTAIGSAINLAMSSSFSDNESTGKTIILITDGENHEDNAVAVAEEAAKKNITVNVLGIGSLQGSPIPTSNGYMKDSSGNMILTKLDEKTAQEIAVAGKGMYVRVDNTNEALKALIKQLNTMQKSDIETKVYSAYDEKYMIPAWILLFLLIGEVFILERKNRIFGKIKLFS
ncbi:MAG: VWA domain-containing protein [Dysgonamonadaceae bacterium]|jgi:Ca-activated chloride channel family protein|nr:VWA domain-containing protein [Dysgonamonadaceae bacterium]